MGKLELPSTQRRLEITEDTLIGNARYPHSPGPNRCFLALAPSRVLLFDYRLPPSRDFHTAPKISFNSTENRKQTRDTNAGGPDVSEPREWQAWHNL